MAQIIANLKGIITSGKRETPADDLLIRNPEKYVQLKEKNKLPDPFYSYTVDQHTGEGTPLQFKFKDYDLSKPMRPAFTEFEENCILFSWAFNDRNGISVKITDAIVKKVTMSFDENDSDKKLKKVG